MYRGTCQHPLFRFLEHFSDDSKVVKSIAGTRLSSTWHTTQERTSGAILGVNALDGRRTSGAQPLSRAWRATVTSPFAAKFDQSPMRENPRMLNAPNQQVNTFPAPCIEDTALHPMPSSHARAAMFRPASRRLVNLGCSLHASTNQKATRSTTATSVHWTSQSEGGTTHVIGRRHNADWWTRARDSSPVGTSSGTRAGRFPACRS